MKRPFILLTSLLSLALAQAPQVEALVDAGRFQEAYEMGLKLSTPEALALAAKGASFYAMYQAKDAEKRAWFERAEKAASQAIAKAPDYPEGYFERAGPWEGYPSTRGSSRPWRRAWPPGSGATWKGP